MGGFHSAFFLFGAGGGTIVPVQTGAATPVTGRDLVSLLNISKETQQLREGITFKDLPSKPGAQINKSDSQFGRTLAHALIAIQDHSNTTDQRLRQVAQQQNNIGLTKDAGGNISLAAATFGIRAGNQNFLLANGRMSYGVANTPPNDADIRPGHVTAYVDEAADELIFRVRYSDGTLKTGVVALL